MDEPKQRTPLEEAKLRLLAEAKQADKHVLIMVFHRPTGDSNRGTMDLVASLPHPHSTELLIRAASQFSPVFQRHLDEALAAVAGPNN